MVKGGREDWKKGGGLGLCPNKWRSCLYKDKVYSIM